MPAKTPAAHPLHSSPAPATVAVQPVGGLHARDQRVGSWTQGLKRHDRTGARQSVKVNVKSDVGVTGGFVAHDQRGIRPAPVKAPKGEIPVRPNPTPGKRRNRRRS